LRVAPDEDQQQTHGDHQVGKYLPTGRVACVEDQPGEQPAVMQQGVPGQGTENKQHEDQQGLVHGISFELITSASADRASLRSPVIQLLHRNQYPQPAREPSNHTANCAQVQHWFHLLLVHMLASFGPRDNQPAIAMPSTLHPDFGQ